MKALNQVAKNPWLEIFIGHWEMRHRLTNYEEGEKVLPDVVALFEKRTGKRQKIARNPFALPRFISLLRKYRWPVLGE